MKKLTAILLIAALLLSFSACGSSTGEKKPNSGATEDEANYPKRIKDNYVQNDNKTGKTYKFTLSTYTTEFNTMYSKLGGNYKYFLFTKWKKRLSEKQDNGKIYNYYYLVGKNVVLTATEDDETKQLVNVGCGITVKKFNSDKNIKSEVMTICGIMAACAGGYSSDDVNFFGNLFVDTISSREHSFWYEGTIYIYDKQTSSDGKDTILFRVMPAASNIENDLNIKDYKDYWFETE